MATTTTSLPSNRRDWAAAILWLVTVPGMFGAIWMVFLYAPEEKVMGAVQKVFYFHVPAALMTYAAVAVLLGGSLGYLWTRGRAWDNLSRSATEIGLFFCTLVLITGPIWARPAWGTWWTWEARLTATLILWLLLVGCLMVRHYADSRDLGARLASILGLVAALDVWIVKKAVEWWRGQHPVVFEPGKSDAVAPQIGQTFGYCVAVFFLLFLFLLLLRYRVAALEDRTADALERLPAR